MRVSKRFPMAVHSLLYIAVVSPKKRVTSIMVGNSVGANAVTIRGLFLDLSSNGLLKTAAGKNGGVSLGREPNEITLWDIYEAAETDDVEEIFKMYEGNGDCPVGKNIYQILYPHVTSAVEAMKKDMQKVTVETLLVDLKSELVNTSIPINNKNNIIK
ncbi:MAG: Rrf2 family transcriptional regulator [Erysipelotrichaceae bacterium]|nr:Rrf2 family transcriptional regulator [Erysipelotrichaceae bacterium]